MILGPLLSPEPSMDSSSFGLLILIFFFKLFFVFDSGSFDSLRSKYLIFFSEISDLGNMGESSFLMIFFISFFSLFISSLLLSSTLAFFLTTFFFITFFITFLELELAILSVTSDFISLLSILFSVKALFCIFFSFFISLILSGPSSIDSRCEFLLVTVVACSFSFLVSSV